MMMAGGSEAPVNASGVGGFNSIQALSERNDSPETASRPFDIDRDGFVLGEGAGALILEDWEHAVRRGAKIYAEIAGTGATADAYHMTAPHPEGEGAMRAMREALKEAGMSIDEIDYINLHATSTTLGDISETSAVAKLFAGRLDQFQISATKSMTGHLLGAAGAVEAAASILAVRDGIVPPTINCKNVDPAVNSELNLTLGKSVRKNIRAALSNNFGFGGHNASIVFRKKE